MRNRNSQSGFTLIELILVMALIAIISAMVAPSLAGFGTGRATKDAASMVIAAANYARTQAVAEALTYRLNFDQQARTIWLTTEDVETVAAASHGDYSNHVELPRGVQMKVDLLTDSNGTSGIAPPTDGLYVVFHPTGRIDTAHVTLSSDLGDPITVGNLAPTELFHVLSAEEARQ